MKLLKTKTLYYRDELLREVHVPYWKIMMKPITFAFIMFVMIGFSTGFSLKYTSIPKVLKPFVVTRDSASKFLTDLDYDQVRMIESGDKDYKTSVMNAVGSMQVTQAGLDEWNINHPKERYSYEDLFIRKYNVKIGEWLLGEQIPLYLKQAGIANSLNYKLIIYNWGWGNFKAWYSRGANYSDLPEETRNYVLRYWAKY